MVEMNSSSVVRQYKCGIRKEGGLGWGCRFERVAGMLSINESANLSLGR